MPSKILEGEHVPSDKGGENWWGYCGNCKGTVDSRCKAGGHSILREPWRAIKGLNSLIILNINHTL